MKKTASLILCLTLLLGCLTACGQPVPAAAKTLNTDITVWYVNDGSPMGKNLSSMLLDYNSGDGAAVGVKATARVFDNEAVLLDELNKAAQKPSMVICSCDAAMTLGGENVPVYTDAQSSNIGLSALANEYVHAGKQDGKLIAVPLAASASVVMVNTPLAEKTPDYSNKIFSSPESICAAAVKYADLNGSHFFTSDSFADLMRVWLAQLGGQFHAQKELDIGDDNYAYLYNLLAEAAYDGGVTAMEEDAVSLVADGKMACAVVSTADVMEHLSDIDAEATAFYPCPVAENGKKLYTVDLLEMVITGEDENRQEAASGFMNWLISDSVGLVEGTGYFPAYSGAEAQVLNGGSVSDIYSSMVSAVKNTLQKRSLYFAWDADYYDNSREFESNFRDTLSGLN